MKTLLGIFVMPVFVLTSLAAQTEGFLPNNLGRIVEISGSEGTLPNYRVLVGWDSGGFVKQSNSGGEYKIFGKQPIYTNLNTGTFPLNRYSRFGAPGNHDCIEIRYGSDSSHYWVGNQLAANQTPFSVYLVGAKPALDTAVTGGIKLCFKVTDSNNDKLYTPGEAVTIYGDMTLPIDSAYDQFGLNLTIPDWGFSVYIDDFRTGKSSVSYEQSTFTPVTDGALPPSRTVIRLIAQTADSAKPFVVFNSSISQEPDLRSYVVSFYSFEKPFFSLINAPAGMLIDSNGALSWSPLISEIGNSYLCTLTVANSVGAVSRVFTAHVVCADHGYVEKETSAAGNLMRLWQRNDGSISYRTVAPYFGLEYPRGSNYCLNYAGGLFLGGIKSGVSDTINVSNVRFESELQPGRILNQGPFGNLICENPDSVSSFFMLPSFQTECWPAEAPHNYSGDPLQLSALDTWTVFNDMSVNKVDDFWALSPGFGVEFRRQTFQFTAYPFNHTVLVRLQMINKTDRNYPQCYFGSYNDPDVGNYAGDDILGVDSAQSILFAYSNPTIINSANTAYGVSLLQGPLVNGALSDTARISIIDYNGFSKIIKPGYKMLSMTSASTLIKGIGFPKGDSSRYCYLKGLDVWGNPKPNGPFDLLPWGSTANDQQFIISSGPFTFAAGDTQEIWYAMIGSQGIDNSSAVDTLLRYVALIRNYFINDMNSIVLGFIDREHYQPQTITLHPNYPNPFNPSTTIRYELKQPSKVSLKIYNTLGQEVRTLVNTRKSQGIHSVVWEGMNNRGQSVTSGVYFYRLQAGDFVKTRKMVLVK